MTPSPAAAPARPPEPERPCGTADRAPDRPTRRRILRWGAGAAAGAAVVGGAAAGGMLTGVLPGGIRLRRALDLTGPDGTVPDVPPGPVRIEQVHSAARHRDVTLVTMLPPGTPASPSLPVCVLLHGRGGDARQMVDLGTPQFLAAAVRSGVPPFAITAVDGGSATYWHQRSPGGDDPQAMLRSELPRWLAAQRLGDPRTALGISMGGSGALQYALGRSGSDPLRAVALLSPAVFRSWPDARTTGGYADEADWRAHEPMLRLGQLRVGALGVWCGAEDPFCPAARELAARAHAQQRHFPAGAHTAGFWRRVMPAAMDFLGRTAG